MKSRIKCSCCGNRADGFARNSRNFVLIPTCSHCFRRASSPFRRRKALWVRTWPVPVFGKRIGLREGWDAYALQDVQIS